MILRNYEKVNSYLRFPGCNRAGDHEFLLEENHTIMHI